MAKILTFDLGTTLYKVALFDDAGRMLALERATPPIDRPQPQWAEVAVRQFMRVLIDATKRLGDLSDVAAVSFATQANSFTLLDQRGEALIPFILWSDQRANELAAQLQMILPRPSPLLALAKVLWLRRHQPERIAAARLLSFISDYLTGAGVTEAGVAHLGGALESQPFVWSKEILRRLQVPPIEMPQVRRAGWDLGMFVRAAEFGLPANCRMIIGCLDQYAGAIGTGTVEPGRTCETTGTVLAAVRCADRRRDDLPDAVFQGPAFDADKWWQMSFSSTSANLLEWYRNRFAAGVSFDELTANAQAADESDLVIEPYDDRGPVEQAFRNVRPEHTQGQVVRAIMRRVAESLKAQVNELCGDDPPTEIRSAGGAARSDYWMQMKADTLGVPMVVMQCEEPTSLGAAMLAARAIGLGSMPELAKRWVHPRKRFDPRPRPRV